MVEPKMRFKGYNDEWVVSSYCEIAKSFKYGLNACAISFDGMNKYLRITDIDDETRCFIQSQLTTPGIDLSLADEYLLQDGDITFARTGASVGKSYIYHKHDGKAYFAGFLIRMQIIDGVSPDFIFQNSLTSRFSNHIKIVSQRSGQPGVNTNELKAYELLIPDSLAEQQQIASYFKSLDILIQSTTKKIASLKQLKSASLISMFPQVGEMKPRVRFKGFEEDWKTVPFDIVFRYLKSNTLSRADLNETLGSARNIHYGDILIKFGTLIDIRKDDLPYITNHFLANQLTNNCKLQKGDIVFADAAEDSTVGKCTEIAFIGEEKVVAGLHTIPCRTLFEFSEGYLGFYLNSPSYHNQLLPLMQGTKIFSISKSALLNTSISFPSSIAEQRQIASFFRSLDTQISLETQRLEKLKQIKSACLDKMFV